MSFQAYLDNIQARTGKTPADFRVLADEKGLTKYPAVLDWLKTDFGLGHGHANAIAQLLVNADKFQASPEDTLAAHFTGDKAHWRETYDLFKEKLAGWGEGVGLVPTRSYISLLRGDRKFGILQISSANCIDLGIKLKGISPTARLESAGRWNNLVTHRVRISDPDQMDTEVLSWLKQAYEAARA